MGAPCLVSALLNEQKASSMARPPNYSFERKERERLKAAKAAEKADAKRLQRERDLAEAGGDAPAPPTDDS